jgi:hypothetical protein
MDATISLTAKHDGLARELKVIEVRLPWLRYNLAHVEADLRLTDSDSNPERITHMRNAVRPLRFGF